MDYFSDCKGGLFVKWDLTNFKFFPKDLERCIESPTFIMDTFPDIQWSLALVPKENEFHVELRRKPKSPCMFCVNITFFSRDKVIDTKNGFINFHNGVFGNLLYVFSFRGLLNLLEVETLTIKCHFWGHFFNHISRPGHCRIQSHHEVENLKSDWTIPDFSSLKPNIRTCYFIPNTWRQFVPLQVILYFTERVCTVQNLCMEIRLNERRNLEHLEIHCKIELLNTSNEVIGDMRSKFLYLLSREPVWRLPKFVEKSTQGMALKDRLLNDTLIVKFEFDISHGESLTNVYDSGYQISRTKNLMTPTPEELSKNLQIQVGSRTFSVPEDVLSSASPFFRQKANLNTILKLTDVEEQTFEELLQFVQTESFENKHWSRVCKLYFAATKYEIVSLCEWCCKYLTLHISVENACQIFHLSNLVKDDKLKSVAEDFIWCNAEVILRSDAWDKLVASDPSLVCDALLKGFWKTLKITEL